MNKEIVYHVPVMLQECLHGLDISPNGRYVDLTFGGGGHSRVILEHLSSEGHLYAFDQDPDTIGNVSPRNNFTFIASNFRHVARFMDYYDCIGKVDAVLADLGVSSHHFDTEDRGFSFRFEEAQLDMRMNTRGGKSALELINEYEEEELARIFYTYGELRQSRQLARKIVSQRAISPIRTISELLEVVHPLINPREEKKQLSMLFQSIRIEVNNELGALEQMLEGVSQILRPGGRLVVMTYHSLEDRIVKNFFRGQGDEDQIFGQKKSPWQLITRKPITPTVEELELNPRSRSAKLRIASYQPH